ncbi:ABC-type transport auxiliary lipoprotein family protein [Nitratifractor sp.]|uniref:ABC-type transport auxiliary lipoprotein family protein n=1 Tax=Nitratifractor sp. TaxID=2268144 RepID=UPI0025FD0B7F|nr:ABC-type transport auxiliary lipoprotein family protein [Nitratifractor sp.]
MIRSLKPLLLTAVALFLAACSSRTLQMYTLSAEAPLPHVPPRFTSLRVDYPKGIEDTMGTRIYFSRSDLTQSYYSYSQWSKSLNRILMANLIETLQRSGLARTVLDYASEADAAYELESTVYRFEHRITAQGSYADVSIGLRLLHSNDRHLIAAKVFNYRIPCPSTDAAGFVKAANEAVSRLGTDMIRWLAKQ